MPSLSWKSTQRTSVFQVLLGRNHSLLVRWDTFLSWQRLLSNCFPDGNQAQLVRRDALGLVLPNKWVDRFGQQSRHHVALPSLHPAMLPPPFPSFPHSAVRFPTFCPPTFPPSPKMHTNTDSACPDDIPERLLHIRYTTRPTYIMFFVVTLCHES